MREKFLIVVLMGLSIVSNSFAIEEMVLTDEQAEELGMTLVLPGVKVLNEQERAFPFKDEYLDLAKVVVLVNKSKRSEDSLQGQTVKVYIDGQFLHEFDTSTGTEKIKKTTSGKKYIATTPLGFYRPKRAFKEYQSYTFFGAVMDYAVFFNRGIAIHSTSKSAYPKLGSRASGGCARLKYEDAQTVNEIIRSTGEGHSRLWDVGVEGLRRNQYSDRVKLDDVNSFNGSLLEQKDRIWTYDALIIVVNS